MAEIQAKDSVKVRWFLISEDDARIVGKALSMAHKFAEADSDSEAFYNDALHTFHSGLHTTDAVPDDFQDAPAATE